MSNDDGLHGMSFDVASSDSGFTGPVTVNSDLFVQDPSGGLSGTVATASALATRVPCPR